MHWFARFVFRRSEGRRCVSAFLLIAYAVTAAGVPISVGSPLGKSGEVFPCMASSCGCRTADQCWRSCCCHSLKERLDWARKRGIEPPAFALAQARALGIDVPLNATECDSGEAAEKCCQSSPQAAAASRATSCCSQQIVPAESENGREQSIVAWRALACRGQSMNWLAATPNMIVARPTVSREAPLIVWIGPARSEFADGESNDPAVPPPESA
jgi:hypothetical protein